ncbi:MAG: DUF1080 domain-containing protein [Acidobacteria bacterium]|nr:DUF1080 domain-containing protein [Acidobacteriota bacterium]
MKPFGLLLLAASAFAADGGWISLFDGKTLNGWKGFRGPVDPVWIVKGGAIVVNREGIAGTPGSGGSNLRTEREFCNFELEWEWKNAPGGNSGLMYRATEEESRPPLTAVEYQLVDADGHPDGKNGPDRWSGAAYALYPPAADARAVAPGQWNKSRIVARGTHVEHYLNGKLACSFEFDSDDWKKRVAASKFAKYAKFGVARRGFIALQDHGHFTAFRAMRIRELK